MAAVDLRAVSKTYDGRQFAVREVSLSVQDGELAVFVCSAAGNHVRGVAWNMDGGWVAQ